MNLRQRLLLMFSVTVIVAVAAVAYTVSFRTREAFAQADQERTNALVVQFHREFDRRGSEIKQKLDRMAGSEAVTRMAFELGRGGDSSTYLNEATSLAQEYGLDFLTVSASDGAIISSAQWPARFGYKEPLPELGGAPFLKKEEMPQGTVVGLFSAKAVHSGDSTIYLAGGQQLDRDFLRSLSAPVGVQVMLVRVSPNDSAGQGLVAAEDLVVGPEKFQPLIQSVRQTRTETSALVFPTDAPEASLFTTAIPLQDRSGDVVSVLLIASPRRGLIALQDHIRSVALTVGGLGILLAIALSLWFTGRITRPVVELAAASRQVASGDWNVSVNSHRANGEIADLAEAFNRMTSQITDQRERLIQSERVAAWRELARRLAHELKNPLFPLQLTVENLVKARHMAPAEFDEIFDESTATLTAEIQNLKFIIQRFSDFSKMPQPQLEATRLNDIVARVATLHEPVLKDRKDPVALVLHLDPAVPVMALDPELMHRVLSNLLLNALDALPQGGSITIDTSVCREDVRLTVADTGTGMTREECERLFTPYYTTKQHGTGLGLAIVQSVITDHGGTISVESAPGQGTTFIIDLPTSTAASGANA